tara:strand:- start:209 stop:667 length:459 start_codon:yes stop_codon:yes gene_type:complete
MSLFEVGRMVLKIAGRDAGKKAVVIDKIDDNHVLIDGQTRRRKCNLKHLEVLPQVIKIKKGASQSEVAAEFKKLGLEVIQTKPKEKTERPRKKRKEKLKERKREIKKAAKTEKPEEKLEKKEETPKPESKDTKASSFEEAVEKESKKEEKTA